MGERKVLCKYFPPDFDPTKVPRIKRDPFKQIEVRMMLPFSMQCGTCGEFMYRGKKFTSRKEDIHGETYLGLRLFRFYIKCITCLSEITFKTDPENGDYALETGGTRNFEIWKDQAAAEKTVKDKREDEDRLDSMKALENRTLDSKIEMDILDSLDEIKAVNQRHERLDMDQILAAKASKEAANRQRQLELDAKEEQLIQSMFKRKGVVRRLSDSEGSGSEEAVGPSGSANGASGAAAPTSTLLQGLEAQMQREQKARQGSAAPVVIVRKKRKVDEEGGKKKKSKKAAAAGGEATAKPAAAKPAAAKLPVPAPAPAPAPPAAKPSEDSDGAVGGLAGLMGAYGSGTDSE